MFNSQRSTPLYLFAIVCSLLLSAWINYSESVINPDAVCYLYSAEEFASSGLKAAMQLCPQAIWPFYSALIEWIVKLTHLSYLHAAFTLDALLSALSVSMFIAIVKALGASRRVLWLAAIVILFSHQFNILRQDIVRDHGFWAFYLASVYLLLKFFKQPTLTNAWGWSISLMVSTLFRVEGALFLGLLPFLAWLHSSFTFRERAYLFLKLNSVLLLGFGGVCVWLCLHPQQSYSLGRISEISLQLQEGFAMLSQQMSLMKTAISQHILTHLSLRDANSVVILLLLSWYTVIVVSNISLLYTLLVLYAWFTQAASFTRSSFSVIFAYLFINVGITLIFFAEHQFLAKRYLVALTLIVMLWIPFALEKCIVMTRHRVLKMGLLVWFSVVAMSGIIPFGYSKRYIHEAGDWLAANVPPTAQLYVNDYQLMYYSRHFGKTIFTKQQVYNDVKTIAQGKWKQYDYVALLKSNDPNDVAARIMQEIHLMPTQVFYNRNGDQVYIYKISH